MNRDNLAHLATYLEALPADYQHFDMSMYMNGDDETEYALGNAPLLHCGTVACACGHGPAAGMPLLPSEIRWNIGDWGAYTERVFELTAAEDDFLFAGFWESFDNTHQGAAARIRYLLDNGAPDAFNYDPSVYQEYVK